MNQPGRHSPDPVSYYIGHLYRLGSMQLSKELAHFSLGYGQYLFLINLYGQDGLKHEDLTARLHVDKSTTTRAITKLYETGYVTIKPDADKRKYTIHLTEKAMQDKEKILAIGNRWEDTLAEGLSTEERDELFRLLKKISAYHYANNKNGADR